MVERITDAIPPGPSRIAVLGLAYKPGTSVTEESPGMALADLLVNYGYTVATYDPLVAGTYSSLAACVKDRDLIVLATDDPAWERLRGQDNVLDWWSL